MTAGSTHEPQNAAVKSRVMGSANDLAADRTRRHRVWTTSCSGCRESCPASRNVIAFMGFGIYRIVLPLFGVMVSAQAELIGGY
jgi:hypothetical protein